MGLRPGIGRLLPPIFVLCLCLCACKEQNRYEPTYTQRSGVTSAVPEYSFGFFPVADWMRVENAYGPLVEMVNQRNGGGFTLRLETSRDFLAFENKLKNRQLDFALANPYQAVTAESLGYRIFSRMGGDDSLQGVIVVRKDSHIRHVSDLRGQTISFPSPRAFGPTLQTKLALLKNGLNADRDAKVSYVGSQSSAVMNVYSGIAAAGGTTLRDWKMLNAMQPEIANALEIRWPAEPNIDCAVIARQEIPEEHVEAVRRVFLNLSNDEQGRKILATLFVPSFHAADSATYDPVRKFLRQYESALGKLPPLGSDNR